VTFYESIRSGLYFLRQPIVASIIGKVTINNNRLVFYWDVLRESIATYFGKDMPAHGLFKKERRAFSHGCIRMDRPTEMASWVLGGEEKGWGQARIDEIVAGRQRQVVVLEQPVPVYILYRTAYVNPKDGLLYF
jgi:murein L,D-transpeptidase YcbB/YkuD